MNHWITADPHYGHKNLIPSESEWTSEKKGVFRDFANLLEHNQTIVNNINKYVKENDTLWILGDFCLGGPDNIWEFRKQINCKNIHLVLGNHDHHIRKNRILDNCKRSHPYSSTLIDGKPSDDDYPDYVEAQTLFSSVNEIVYRKFENINFVLCHYSMRYWQNASTGAIMLYGDTHDRDPDFEELIEDEKYLIKTGRKYKTMDVSVDSAKRIFGEYRPFNIKEITSIMLEKNKTNR